MSNAQANPAPTGGAAAPASAGSPPHDLAARQRAAHRGPGVLRVVARHWKLTLAWAALCAAAAWFVGDRFKQLTWQAEGTLIYTPLTLPENQRAVYAAPNADTLTNLVKGPNNLEAIRREFGLAMPAKELDKRIKVNRPYNSDTVVVSLDWAEPAAGAAMLNRLMALHAAGAVSLRKKRTEDAAASLEGAVREARARYEHAAAGQAAFLATQTGGDPQIEAARLGAEIATLEGSLLAAGRECEDCEGRLKGAADAAGAAGAPAAPDGPPGAAEVDAGSQLYQRRTQVEDALATEKGTLAEARTALDAKQQEHDVAARFVVEKAIPRADFDKLTAELQGARQHVENSELAVKRYEQELRGLPARAASLKKSQLEQRLDDKRREAALLKSALAAKRDQADAAAQLVRRAAPLGEKVKDAKAELDQYEAAAAALRQLHDSDAAEVAVLNPAAPAASPAASTRKTITAVAFAAPMLLFVGLLVVRDRVRAAGTPAAALEKMGLEVLTPPPGPAGGRPDGAAGAGLRAFRRVALRVRERIADAGPVLLFSSLNGGAEAEHLACLLGKLLGTEDERLLILDMRPGSAALAEPAARVPLPDVVSEGDGDGESTTRAVGRFLGAAEEQRPDGRPAVGSAAVNYLRAAPVSDPDFLASKQMSDLLGALAGKYARIIVVASPVGESMEAESLAAWADAVILTVGGRAGPLPAGAEDAVRSLQEGQAPVYVVCTE